MALLLAWLLCQEAKGDRRGITLGCVQHVYLDGRGRLHLVIQPLFGGACCLKSGRAERITNRALVNQGIFSVRRQFHKQGGHGLLVGQVLA